MRKRILKIKVILLFCSASAFSQPIGSSGSSVGIAEIFSGDSHILLFPNPASTVAYIIAREDRITTLDLFTIESKLLYSEVIPEGQVVRINVQDLSDGVYLARVTTVNGMVETKKIIVRK